MLMWVLEKRQFSLSLKALEMDLELHYSQFIISWGNIASVELNLDYACSFRHFILKVHLRGGGEDGGNLTLNQLFKDSLSKHL